MVDIFLSSEVSYLMRKSISNNIFVIIDINIIFNKNFMHENESF